MNGQEYLELLKKRLTHYYDIKETQGHTQPEFVLQAELNAADEGYFIVPDLKTYSVQHNEYLYVQQFGEPLTLAMAEPYIAYTKKAMAELKTTTEHMSSVFSLVFICEAGIEADALAQLTKLRQHKDYCFTLKGWSDLALFLVDIPAQSLHHNKAAAKNAATFAFPKAE